MQKQKKGFLLFICSLIPGAGEMYMGFFKQGISIMTLFWAIVAISGGLNIASLVIFLPVIWFYSFFHVHNLKELPEEEFYAVEDNYILHLDRVFRNSEKIAPKHIKIAAVLLIIFGIAILWNGFQDLLYWILPGSLAIIIQDIMYQIPSIIIGILIIIAGYQLLTGKLKNFSQEEKTDNLKNDQEHYWQPYRPYQQPTNNTTSQINRRSEILPTEASINQPVPAADNTPKDNDTQIADTTSAQPAITTAADNDSGK